MGKEVIEGNKLIAEFMGAKVVSLEEVNRICKTSYTPDTRPDDTKEWIYFDPEGKDREHKFSNLKYHSSWDCLMPVIGRLEECGYAIMFGGKDEDYFETKVYYILYDIKIASSYGAYCRERNKKSPLIIVWNEIKILSVYSAVVKAIEFINWYNQQRRTSMENMTPQEKAKHLEVPLLEGQIEEPLTEQDKAKEKQMQGEAMKLVLAYANETVAVCGKCGKEISRQDNTIKQPCGDAECPFGYLTNNKSK